MHEAPGSLPERLVIARRARGPLRRAPHPAYRCTVLLWTLTLVSRLERRGPPARAIRSSSVPIRIRCPVLQLRRRRHHCWDDFEICRHYA